MGGAHHGAVQSTLRIPTPRGNVPQNECHNGLFRTFVPKGASIEAFSAEYILAAADELNGRPRKKLGYRRAGVQLAICENILLN